MSEGENQPFPDFKSKNALIAKHLTEERWEKLHKHKTATCGFTLKQGIACAVEYDDQHVGFYCGDADTYEDFSDVLDPLILEYHGLFEGVNHTSDLDVSKLVGNIDPEAPVKSTRIRVGRNIEGFGLSPGITQEQRLGVENLMKNAFEKLEVDLAGKYYPLLGMDEEIRQKLVDDHFLFMSGDKNLVTSGMERDWPEGRGIYHNDEKTFLVWVNEEDQLRIISMEKGGDVKGVFERLTRGISAVGDSVKGESGKDFMLHPKYGFLHSCPSNLGTGMRASVHIDLPGWTKEGLDALKKRCEELSLQPRGTKGESGGQTGVTYDISNKHRLGYTEVQLVQTMINGVNALYKEDLTLQEKHGLIQNTNMAEESSIEPQPFPGIKSKESLAYKYITEEVWNRLCTHKTKTCGFTLAQGCAHVLQFDDQHVGMYAGDADSYEDFADVFKPLIADYHKLPEGFTHASDMDASKIVGNIDPNVPVKSTRIRVGRNIEGFGLSPGITQEQRLGVENLMKNAFGQLKEDLSGKYYPLLGMEETDRQKLIDDHFLFIQGDKAMQATGMERDWPEGRGIYHNDEKTFLVWVNEEDQLRIISMEKGGDVKGVFERLTRGISAVADSVKGESGKEFLLHDQYGYIHSCPSNLGTGMRASVHVDLAGWTKEGLDALKARCNELALQPRGTRGESGGQTGITYDISNKHRLGYSEVQLIQTMIDGVNTLYKEDLELQKKHGINADGTEVAKESDEPQPFPGIKSKESLAYKYITKEIWDKLCTHKTATCGFTLAQGCAHVLQFDDQHVGMYAGDADSYEDFADVFKPLIADYHKLPQGFTHASDMDASKIVGNIDANVPVKSTRIRVGRNIEGFGLSPGITQEQRLGVENLMKNAFGQLKEDLSGKYYPLLGMEEAVRQKLIDDHFLFIQGDKAMQATGMERDWPEGRGIYHNDEKTFLVWVNEEDQLRIISMEKGGDVKGVFERLTRGISAVADSVKAESGKVFLLHDQYGYIHSCPSNLGTGMRASVHVDLAGWTKEGLDALKARCNELALQPRGTRGESGGQTGITYDISNKHRLGYSEVQLIQTMIDGVNTLYKEDVELQKKHGIDGTKTEDKPESEKKEESAKKEEGAQKEEAAKKEEGAAADTSQGSSSPKKGKKKDKESSTCNLL